MLAIELAQRCLVVFGQPPVEHHLAGKLRIPSARQQLFVKVRHQRFEVERRLIYACGRDRGIGVMVINADDNLLLFLRGQVFSSKFVLLVGTLLDPVARGAAVFALDIRTILNGVAEHVALEATDPFAGMWAI